MIEQRLIYDLQRKVMSFNLQDLSCLKCGSVKLGNLAQRCECAGEMGIVGCSSVA